MTTEYFSSFPFTVNQDGQEVVNITYRIDFINRIKDNIALFQHVNIVTGQRPEDIALIYYNDQTLYWIVLWLNNIVDPYYDWLLTDKELFTYVQNKYGSQNVYATNHYETTSAHSLGAGVWVDSTNTPNVAISNIAYEQSLNEAKRQIKIVKPYYINQIIGEYEQELTHAATK